MIRPKRVKNKQQYINALYIVYKELSNLEPNSCVGVNRTYFNTLANYAIQHKITDKHFWNIVKKYETYEKYKIYSSKYKSFSNCSNFHVMSLRDIYYLIHVTKVKSYRITTFIKVNMTEDELEEKHRQVFEEYWQKKLNGEKTKKLYKL